MRRFYLAAILLAAVGCEGIETDEVAQTFRPSDVAPTLMTVHARIGDATRTSLAGERGTEVHWSAGDAIGMWGDGATACRRYGIDDRFAGGTAAEFTGEAFEAAVYYACYPYRADAVADESGVTLTLPTVQPFGGSGTFAPNVSLMAACGAQADDLHFISVGGVVRLQLTGRAAIRSVRLTALDGAPLAGRMRIGWSAADGWTMRSADAGHPSVLLDCGAEGVLLDEAEPVVFCLVVPPGLYRGWRFTITDTAGGQMVRETTKTEVVLEANHIKTYNPFAYAAAGEAPVALDVSGTANCYVVARAGCYEFDATTMGNGAATPPDASYAAGSTGAKKTGIVPEPLRPATAKLLWQTSPALIGEVTLGAEGRIRFRTAEPFAEGNAVVAACDADGTILWSWHLWLTAADPSESLQRYALTGDAVPSGEVAMMDRNLGALTAAYQGADNVSSYGMFYQWGRKDPFVPYRTMTERVTTYDADGRELPNDETAQAAFVAAAGWRVVDGKRSGASATVEAAVRHPMNFITEVADDTDWYCVAAGDSRRDDLWGCADAGVPAAESATKSIYDPCPPGYRVPHRFVWTAFAPTADAVFSEWYVRQSSVSACDGIVFEVAGCEIYYPAAGALLGTTGRARFTGGGWYVWSASPYASDRAMAGAFVKSSLTSKLLGSANRSYGAQVRCMRE